MPSRPRATAHHGASVVRRRLSALLLAVPVAVALLLMPLRWAAAQEGSTEPSVPELLVPGDPSATTVPTQTDAGDTDAGSPATTSVPATGDDGLAASTKVWIIIGALVGVALLVLLLTIIFWQRTRPTAVAARQAGKARQVVAVDPPAGAASTPAPVGAAASGPTAQPPATTAGRPEPETPRPVGDTPPLDPGRSIFAPQPPSDEPPPG